MRRSAFPIEPKAVLASVPGVIALYAALAVGVAVFSFFIKKEQPPEPPRVVSSLDPLADTRLAWVWMLDTLMALREHEAQLPCGDSYITEVETPSRGPCTGKDAFAGAGKLCKANAAWGKSAATVLWVPGKPAGIGVLTLPGTISCGSLGLAPWPSLSVGSGPRNECVSPIGQVKIIPTDGQTAIQLTTLDAIALCAHKQAVQ